MERNSSKYIMMVRPASFGFNEITAKDNAFQNESKEEDAEVIKNKAIQEFDGYVERLRAAGVHVIVIEDTPSPVKPDAIFPNNWISTHDNGRVFLYPMKAENRRLEVRGDVVDFLGSKFQLSTVTDWSTDSPKNIFLEGTGSMIFDRPNKICYACISQRTDKALLEKLCTEIGYEVVAFISKDENAQDIYHTNVMLSVATDFAVVCGESIPDDEERAMVFSKLSETGKEIIDVNFEQLHSLCCNVLEASNDEGEKIFTMSERAYKAFTKDQIAVMEKYAKIVNAPIYTIEDIGGGGSRCMMAEIYLPEN